MGLIDSTNRIERAILSDKQAKRLEREEKKRERKQKEREKLDISISKDLMEEALYNEFGELYNILGYNGANLYLKSLESREKILCKIAKNELDYKIASGLYDKTLSSIDKIYKHDEQFKTAQKLEELRAEQEKEIKKHNFAEICKIIAYCIYTSIIAIIKICGFFLLLCLGFTKFVYTAQPQHKRRYR